MIPSLVLTAVAALLAVSGFLFFRLYRLQRREGKDLAEDLRLVSELSVELASVKSLDELLPLAMDAFVKAGAVNEGSLLLLNEDQGVLEIRAAVGLSDAKCRKFRPRVGEGLVGTAAATGKPAQAEDASGDPVFDLEYQREGARRVHHRLLALPLKYKEKVLGVVCLESRSDGRPFTDHDRTVLAILSNAVAVAVSNAQLYELATTDGLTKLGTHRYFQVRLDQELSRARRYQLPLALVMLDLDHFKRFNDAYGHPEGDRVLAQVGRILKENSREIDLCARYGGEEFAIILPVTKEADALVIAERIRSKIEAAPVQVQGRSVTLTLSGGVASYAGGERAMPKDELIRRADRALYHAKHQGRNRIVLWNQVPAPAAPD